MVGLLESDFIGKLIYKAAHERSWQLKLRKDVVDLLRDERANAWLENPENLSTEEKEQC